MAPRYSIFSMGEKEGKLDFNPHDPHLQFRFCLFSNETKIVLPTHFKDLHPSCTSG